MTNDEYARAAKDLYADIEKMRGFFAREGMTHLVHSMDEARQGSATGGEYYDSLTGCLNAALREPALEVARRKKIKNMLKMIRVMFKEARMFPPEAYR